MGGNMFDGIGLLVEGLMDLGLILIGAVLALVILLGLSLFGVWSWWFLLLIPVLSAIVRFAGRKVLG